MMLNINIKLFFVENYIIQVELYIGIYVKNICTHLKGAQSLSDINVHFIATKQTPPQTDSLVF